MRTITLAQLRNRAVKNRAFFLSLLQEPDRTLQKAGLVLSAGDRARLDDILDKTVVVTNWPKKMARVSVPVIWNPKDVILK